MSTASDRADRLALEPLHDMFPPQGFFRGSLNSFKEIWHRRELLSLLVRREIRAKYKDSALGLLWSLVRPLVMLAIYYFVIGQLLGVARAPGMDYYAIYMYAGLTVWSLFQESVTSGTGSILTNAGIVKKTALPREIFPLTSIGAALFNFFVQLVILIVAVALTCGFNFSINFLHFPLAVLVILVWATALAFFLSALNVYLRDVQYLTEVVLMIGFYLSPIIYPWSIALPWFSSHPVLQEIYLANPVTLAVMGTQRVMWNSSNANPWPSYLAYRLLAALVVGLIALLLAQRYFSRMQRNFAQEI